MSAELLAPAGDFETALAAFEAGADAVYCGLGSFSARAFAKNFSEEELKKLIRFARAKQKKVYVTFNTILDEAQLEGAIEKLAMLEEIGPDAVIVQDLGVARLCRKHFPELTLHASTQMVAHNLEGVLALKELGFRRVVLARELSLEEIASIAKRCGDIELEVFIHGALCYSISGLCLFGAMEKGRSGNRGACPYCCREGKRNKEEGISAELASGCGGKVSYPFSMKDLRVGEDVRKLVEAGVKSLKIEGRMKSALYVASVTRYYQALLDGGEVRSKKEEVRSKAVTISDLETVFSRRTTELYLNGARGYPPSEASFAKQSGYSGVTRLTGGVIDSESLGHLGAAVGTLKKVTKDREGRRWMRFHTARALERHDGLQFANPEGGKPFGFGIGEMRSAISRTNVFEVAAGTDVEIALPELPESEDWTRQLKSGMTVYCSMSNEVKRRFPVPSFRDSDYPGTYGIDVELTIAKDKVTATLDGMGDSPTVSIAGNFEPATHPEKTREAAEKAFSKLGGTDYRLRVLTLNDPEQRFVPASVVNDLRRDLVEQLDERRSARRREKIEEALDGEDIVHGFHGFSRIGKVVKVRVGQVVPPGEWDEVVVAVNSDTVAQDLSAFTFQLSPRLALPVWTGELEFNKLRNAVKRLVRAGFEKWEASDLATLRMLKQVGVADITADWTLYVFNSWALAAFAELGVKRFVASPENGRENRQFLAESGYDVECLVQQSTPLFISLTKPGEQAELAVFQRDGLWVTTKSVPRTFEAPKGVSTRVDLSWDCPAS